MKQQHPKDFKQLSYFLKTGNVPTPAQKKVEKWQLMYGKLVLADNCPYGALVNLEKLYKRMGKIYPQKELFKIIPAP